MWPPSFPDLNTHGLLCVVYFGDKCPFCCTHECAGGFEAVSGWRMGQNTSGTYRAVLDEFQRRLDIVIDVKGGHMEK